MGERLRDLLGRIGRWIGRDRAQRREVRARARFWYEVREGEREAEARSSR
jgi:hypothetical protein